MKFETILYEIENKILTITLNRPEKLNAFTGQMMDDLIKAFDQAGKDDGIRVIVITESELDTGAWGDKSKWIKTSYNTKDGKHFVPKDHQDFSDILMEDLMNKIKKLKLNKVIITEKDLVKIPQFFIDAFDIYVIKISMNIKDELIMQNKIDALLN